MEEFDDGGDHGKERMLEARNLVKDLHAGSSFLPVAVSSKSPGRSMIELCPRSLVLHCSVMESLPDSPTKAPSMLFGKLDCGMVMEVGKEGTIEVFCIFSKPRH